MSQQQKQSSAAAAAVCVVTEQQEVKLRCAAVSCRPSERLLVELNRLSNPQH